MDQLMDAQMQTLDLSEREKDFNEVQEILAEQQPMIFTVTPMYYAAIRSDIGNVRATPLSYYQRDVERRGALLQKIIRRSLVRKSQITFPATAKVPSTAKANVLAHLGDLHHQNHTR